MPAKKQSKLFWPLTFNASIANAKANWQNKKETARLLTTTGLRFPSGNA